MVKTTSPPFKDCQCVYTSTVAPVSYVQSCLLAACSQHDGWMSGAGRPGNHEVTSGGGRKSTSGGFLAKVP